MLHYSNALQLPIVILLMQYSLLVAIVCYGMVSYAVIVQAPYNLAPHHSTVSVTSVVIILPNIHY